MGRISPQLNLFVTTGHPLEIGLVFAATRLPSPGPRPEKVLTVFYRRSPLEIGWETFDIDCCLPVQPLRGR